VLDLAELCELVDRLLLRTLEQRPAGRLDPLPGTRAGAVVGISLVTADLVNRALAEADDVKRVKADVGVRDVGVDRLLVAAGHVDRHSSDRVFALAEEIEERLQRSGIGTRRAPPDRAGLVATTVVR